MRKRKKRQLKDRHLLIVMTIVCAGLILSTLSSDRISGPVRTVAGYVITPFQNGINLVGNWLIDHAAGLKDVRELSEENRMLRERVDELTEQNNELLQNQDELKRLQSLYELDEHYSEYDKVAATVISKDPGNWYGTFVINKGRKDGILPDMNVLANGALAGIVTEAGENWAQVRSIIDDESNVSAMARSTSDTCTVTGSLLDIDEGKIRFIQLRDPDNRIREGEAIVTSNISSKFLPGILIGYISEIEEDANKLTKSGRIIPVADFHSIREVLVITTLKTDPEDTP